MNCKMACGIGNISFYGKNDSKINHHIYTDAICNPTNEGFAECVLIGFFVPSWQCA